MLFICRGMMMTACDVAAITKPWEIQQRVRTYYHAIVVLLICLLLKEMLDVAMPVPSRSCGRVG